MNRKSLSAALVLCSSLCLLFARPAFSEEYKLREAAEYVKDRNGEPIPHVVTSEHFALKWGNENNKNYKIDDEYAKGALKWFEYVRTVYRDQVGWPYIKSEAGKFKVNIYITETGLKPFLTGYAFGFADPEGYGVFCAEPSTMVWGHGASAHELGHSAEGETGNFVDSDYVGFFWECCAQFLAQQAVPTKNLPESLDLFCDMCQFDFATATNWHQYANWPLMQYFSEKPGYGNKFIVDLWMTKATYQDEDPISKMRRLGNISPDAWADIVGDYAKRNVTFSSYKYGKEYKASLDKVQEKTSKRMARWKMALEPIKGREGWFRIPYAAAPHQTAFNVIPLRPTSGTITVDFKGLVDESRQSDWRATIVVPSGGKDRYSRTIKAGKTSIRLKPGEQEAYLVVAAAPHVYDAIGFLRDYRTQERFPYEVKITGASPKGKDDSAVPPSGVAGARHPNGGGFVAATARAAATAYVGPNAMVLDNAVVNDSARIEGFAVISKDAVVSGNAIVSGHALVTDKAVVSGYARIRDYVGIYDSSSIEGNARFMDYAEAEGSPHVYGNVVARGHSNINGGNLHGTAMFTGATNPGKELTNCSKGVYTIYVTQEDCDKAPDLGGLYASYNFTRANNLLLVDSVLRADGFLKGGPDRVPEPGRGYALSFNGKDQFVELPGSISDLRNFELSTSVKWEGGTVNQKIFDFGRDSANCMYLTPRSDSGKAVFAIVKDGHAESIEAPPIAADGEWHRITVTLKGDVAALKVDGQPAATGTISGKPEELNADSNYLARGQTGGFFVGQMREFNVYIRD